MLKIKNGFTFIELVVVLTIIAIFTYSGNQIYKTYLDDNRQDRVESDIQNLGGVFSFVITQNGGVRENYCKNSLGGHDSACFKIDPLLDGDDDGICLGNDLTDVDCDSGCAIVSCDISNNYCSGDKEYYDFNLILEDYGKSFKYNNESEYLDNFSYRICPEGAIGKAVESEFTTFNPSFSFYNKSRELYRVNSNP